MDSTPIKFKAGLSNGETAIEGKGRFAMVPGELSPINKLLAYCEENDISITSLTLVGPEGQEFHAPTSAKNPRFKAFADAERPLGYKIYRKAGGDVLTGNVTYEYYTVAETLYDGFSLQLWVSHAKPHQAYTLIAR